MEEAVLSILAGDAFAAHTRFPILLFKACYYVVCLVHPIDNWKAYRRRSRGTSAPVTDVTDYAVNQSS